MTARPLSLLFGAGLILASVSGLPQPLFASSFTETMESAAMDLAQALALTPQRPVHFTLIPEDGSYLLPMEPVFQSLRQQLAVYTGTVTTHSFRGKEHALICSMIRSGGTHYAPVVLPGQRLDSLILTGSYFLCGESVDTINFSIDVLSADARTLFQSGEYTLWRGDCPPGIRRAVFDRLRDERSVAALRYTARVIAGLESLFNSPNNNLLAFPAEYVFDKRHPYAMQWQIDRFKEILAVRYGVTFPRSGPDTIIIEPTGAAVFIRGGNERQIVEIIDGEPLFPCRFSDAYDSLYYLYADRASPGQTIVEKKNFETPGELTARTAIYEIFSTRYPSLFDPLDIETLERIFVEKDRPSILAGMVVDSDPRTGRERVAYAWHTKKGWLAALCAAKFRLNRTFRVKTDVMGVFHDTADPGRYWAVVLQRWQTKDREGAVVYQDEGFLIVNFDFSADHVLKNFAIHYRLWFNNYRYDDLELGIRRHEKLIRDMDRYFTGSIGGIDAKLKIALRDLIVRKITVPSAAPGISGTQLHPDPL